MATICDRNSMLEDLHAGPVPVTKTGDYSDVFVIDADGNRIPWGSVSRLDDDEMRDLMRQVVKRLYAFQTCFAEPQFQAGIDKWLGGGAHLGRAGSRRAPRGKASVDFLALAIIALEQLLI